jgi:hypothetical protein
MAPDGRERIGKGCCRASIYTICPQPGLDYTSLGFPLLKMSLSVKTADKVKKFGIFAPRILFDKSKNWYYPIKNVTLTVEN